MCQLYFFGFATCLTELLRLSQPFLFDPQIYRSIFIFVFQPFMSCFLFGV